MLFELVFGHGSNTSVLTSKGEIGKQSNVIGTLSAFGQLSKYEKSPPSSAFFSESNTLDTNSQRIEVAFRHTISFDNSQRANPLKGQENKRKYDTACKDPFRGLERDFDVGLHLTGPALISKNIYGCKGVDNIDGNGDEK